LTEFTSILESPLGSNTTLKSNGELTVELLTGAINLIAGPLEMPRVATCCVACGNPASLLVIKTSANEFDCQKKPIKTAAKDIAHPRNGEFLVLNFIYDPF
jgi:hypothetical protein